MEELKIKFQIPNNIVGENFVGDATYIKMIRGMWNILHTKYISVNIGVDACAFNPHVKEDEFGNL
jgi:hypothetical protein